MAASKYGCLGGLANLINQASVAVTSDFVMRKEVSQPKHWRAILRTVLTVVVATLVVGAIVVIAVTQPDTKVSRENYSTLSLPMLYPPLPPGPINLYQGIIMMNDIICPCVLPNFPWAVFVNYSLIYPDLDGLKEDPLVDIGKNKLCNEISSDANKIFICQGGLGAILPIENYLQQKNIIQSPNLLTPTWLYADVLAQITTNIETKMDSYYLFKLNNLELYNYSLFILSLIAGMENQLARDISSTKEDFWKASRSTLESAGVNTTQNFSTQYALGMSIDWDLYAESCGPSFCDITYLYSKYYKVFHAIAEVGGFLTIGLFIVRVLIWPTITKIFLKHARKDENEDVQAP